MQSCPIAGVLGQAEGDTQAAGVFGASLREHSADKQRPRLHSDTGAPSAALEPEAVPVKHMELERAVSRVKTGERGSTTKRIWQQQAAPSAVSSDNTLLMRGGGSRRLLFLQQA
ncbi:hypothetical protein SRHO_G00050420 [Serrasalmus rhombeus]